MPAFHNEDERDAWTLAESLMDKGRAMMRQAESALESFMIGKEMNRLRCAQRGIGTTDAEIRWGETFDAKKALSDSSFNVTQAMMYYGAAAAHYSRAAYLRSGASQTERRPDRGGGRDWVQVPPKTGDIRAAAPVQHARGTTGGTPRVSGPGDPVP